MGSLSQRHRGARRATEDCNGNVLGELRAPRNDLRGARSSPKKWPSSVALCAPLCLCDENPSHSSPYCFTAQRTDTVSTTFNSPGFTGVGSAFSARPADRSIISLLMGMGGSDGPPLEISISAPS